MIVGADGVRLPRAVEVTLGRVNVVLDQSSADILQAEAQAGQRRGIDANAHGRLLIAFDGHQTDAGDLAEFLCQDRVGKIVYLLQGKSLGGEGER